MVATATEQRLAGQISDEERELRINLPPRTGWPTNTGCPS